MTTVTSPTALIETHFGGIKDPRAAHSIAWRVTRNAIEHKLIDILIITICATICGANDRSAITQYGRAKQEWLKTWLELPNGIPSPDTFNRVFARLKPEELQKCFVGWRQAVQTVTEGELLNIDGKTLREIFTQMWCNCLPLRENRTSEISNISFTQQCPTDMGGLKLVAIGLWVIQNT